MRICMPIIIRKIFPQGDSCCVSYQVADTDELSESRECLEMMIQMPTLEVKSVTLNSDSGQVEIEVPADSEEIDQ
jgi:hypothetical protein